jgi:hypothetical protein
VSPRGAVAAKPVAAPAAPRFVARDGSRISNAVAERVGPILDRLVRDHGVATPELLLDEARDPNSPAHDAFTWDDSAAAVRWRIEEAKKLIRSIAIVVESVEGPAPRAFLVVNRDGEDGYVPLAVVMADIDLARQVIERAKNEQAIWYRRHQQLRHAAELAGVFDAIEKAVPTLFGGPAKASPAAPPASGTVLAAKGAS